VVLPFVPPTNHIACSALPVWPRPSVLKGETEATGANRHSKATMPVGHCENAVRFGPFRGTTVAWIIDEATGSS
jgi:hypothetical protein